MIRRLAASIALLCALSMPAAASAAEPTALETFKDSHEKVVALVKGKAKAAKIQKNVDGLLDYDWIAKASLGGPKRYAKRCEPRCAEFEELLTKLIRENYLKRIRLSDKGSVDYLGEDVRKRASKVNTQVTYTKNGRQQKLRIDYVMHASGDSWQVRDIITDGVSLSGNYRYEFKQIYAKGGIDALIERLAGKLAEVAKND